MSVGTARGRLLVSNSAIPEMRERKTGWARKYLFFGTVLIVLTIFTDFVLLVLVPFSPITALTAVLISVLFVPLGLSTSLDAFLYTYVDVYEKGLTLPDRKLREVIRGHRDRYVPFVSITGVITNRSNAKAPNVAIYVGEKELLIDKRDIHDLVEFERIVRGKVRFVWDVPASYEEVDAALSSR